MKLFISHSSKDELLALELTSALIKAGLDVWQPDDVNKPGSNWAHAIGDALESTDFMVALLTPGAIQSDSLRQNIEHAISSEHFKDRLFTVMVGPTLSSPGDVPWILRQLPHEQIKHSPEELRRVAEMIADMLVGA